MTREELLKEIMKLPKAETDNPISTMNSINVDDLINAVDRLNKIPDYNDLLRENQELKKKYENAVSDYETTMFEKEQLNSLVNSCQEEIRELKKQVENYKKLGFKYLLDKNNNLETQQKDFIKYLEDYLKLFDYMCIDEQADYDMIEEILQKYKEIIGG